jgi:hypothetical protein
MLPSERRRLASERPNPTLHSSARNAYNACSPDAKMIPSTSTSEEVRNAAGSDCQTRRATGQAKPFLPHPTKSDE